MPVHYAGVGTDFDDVRALVAGRPITVIEDAAHALGARRGNGRPVGSAGAFACFSFAPTKPLASCSGGLIVFEDGALGSTLSAVSCLGLEVDTFSRFSDRRDLPAQHVGRLGWHYRANDVACALAVAQLERMEEIRARRAALEAAYRERLGAMEGVELLRVPEGGLPCWYLLSIRVPADRRDSLRRRLADNGIDCGIHYSSLRRQPLFAGCRGEAPVAEREAARIVTLPLHEGMNERDVERVCAVVCSSLRGD
jgi:dTDP-4-amino-4,6-dideoxygalactose transaminase